MPTKIIPTNTKPSKTKTSKIKPSKKLTEKNPSGNGELSEDLESSSSDGGLFSKNIISENIISEDLSSDDSDDENLIDEDSVDDDFVGEKLVVENRVGYSKTSHFKTGRLTNPEKKWIDENAEFLNEQEIAKHLNRRVQTIKWYVKCNLKKVTKKQEVQLEAEFNIKAKKYWKQIKQQFTQGELELFVQYWSEIVEQFNSDVAHTEALQIIDLIKLEILCDRCLSQQKHVIDSINTLQKLAEDEKLLGKQRDKDKIFQYEQQIQLSRGARDSLQKEYLDLLNKKEAIRKSLSGTRSQRYKNLEQSKTNFRSWMKEIITNDGLRLNLGNEMSKDKEAFESEKRRLSKDHQFLDKIWDKCLLTPETVLENEEDEVVE